MPEVRIKTDFGEIVIPYNEISDLEKGLSNFEEVNGIVNAKVGKIKEKPKVKPGFEDIYIINEDGTVSILKSGTKTEYIGIVLFAYSPTPLRVDFISKSSAVKNAKDFLGKSKNFDRLEHGFYKLNSTGLNWIINEVVPAMKLNNKGP